MEFFGLPDPSGTPTPAPNQAPPNSDPYRCRLRPDLSLNPTCDASNRSSAASTRREWTTDTTLGLERPDPDGEAFTTSVLRLNDEHLIPTKPALYRAGRHEAHSHEDMLERAMQGDTAIVDYVRSFTGKPPNGLSAGHQAHG